MIGTSRRSIAQRVRITPAGPQDAGGTAFARSAGPGRVLQALLAVALLVLGLGAAGAARALNGRDPHTVRIGYLATTTHAVAYVAQREGFLERAVRAAGGPQERVSVQAFSSGPAVIEALNSGALDAAYLGPVPTLNSYLNSEGRSLRILAGATSGGASLVVRPDIAGPDELSGARLATPQEGGSQDLALRAYLADHGMGETGIAHATGAQVLTLFRQGRLDGAFLPEPWASQLVAEGGARVLVDERDLWPERAFPTAVLVANQDFLAAHPELGRALRTANAEAVDWLARRTGTAAGRAQIAALLEAGLSADGQPVERDVLLDALGRMSFTTDPLAGTLSTYWDRLRHLGTGETTAGADLDPEGILWSGT